MSASNQLTPMHKDPIVYTIAVLLVFALWILFGGCRDSQDPPKNPEEKITGAWERNWLTFTDTYSFDGHGQCLAYAIVPGQPVQLYASSYTFEGDTISIRYLGSTGGNADVRRAVVGFPDDSTCVLGWIGGVQYFLKRL